MKLLVDDMSLISYCSIDYYMFCQKVIDHLTGLLISQVTYILIQQEGK